MGGFPVDRTPALPGAIMMCPMVLAYMLGAPSLVSYNHCAEKKLGVFFGGVNRTARVRIGTSMSDSCCVIILVMTLCFLYMDCVWHGHGPCFCRWPENRSHFIAFGRYV